MSHRRIVTYCTILILIIISYSQYSYCQKKDVLIVKFAPSGIINPWGPNLHFGLEFLSNSKRTLETDFAVYIPNYHKNDETPRIKDRKGFKIKPEIRFYPNWRADAHETHKGIYVADELFFLMDHYKRGDTFRQYDQILDTTYLYFDYERINRFEFGDRFKVGYQLILGKRFAVDSYIGIGMKYLNSKYEYKIEDDICCPTFNPFAIPTGKGLRASFTIGVKIGIVI